MPYIHVTYLSGAGWGESRLTLRQYSRAKRYLAKCEFVAVTLEGSLV